MEKENEILQGFLEYLFTEQPIEYKNDAFCWISYPEGRYKPTRITKNDVAEALACKIEENGDRYDLTEAKGHRCIPKEEEEE